MPKTPKVVPMIDNRPRLIASDEKSKRFILSIGGDRVAFDFTTRVTKLPPNTGDKPAEVLLFKKPPNQKK
jgi:hypothetical protein